MKVAKSLLLGTAAVLATVAGAQAADLPTRKAAPVQYVKICDAYGAGFFYIPGTDTCLRVGGLVLADLSVSNTPDRLASVGLAAIGGAGSSVTGAEETTSDGIAVCSVTGTLAPSIAPAAAIAQASRRARAQQLAEALDAL